MCNCNTNSVRLSGTNRKGESERWWCMVGRCCGWISKEAVGNSWVILNDILGHKVLKSIKHVHLANEGKLSTKVNLIFCTDWRLKRCVQVGVHNRVLRRHQHWRHQHWGSVHVVTRNRLDLDQTSMAHPHAVRQIICDKTHLLQILVLIAWLVDMITTLFGWLQFALILMISVSQNGV